MHRSRLATIFIDFAPDSDERGMAFWSGALGKAVMPTNHEQYRSLKGRIRGHVVMTAPSGHPFCVVPVHRPDCDANATVWDDGE